VQTDHKEDLLVLLHGRIDFGGEIVARLVLIGLFAVLTLGRLRFVRLLGLLLALLLAIAADLVLLDGEKLERIKGSFNITNIPYTFHI